MPSLIRRYTRWLHTQWPAGEVEKLPAVGPDGSTNVPGVYVAGDLTGIPLLKFSAESGARVVQTIHADREFAAARRQPVAGVVDLAIVGGGVAGMSAALEARRLGLDFVVLEAAEPFATIVNFPKQKPIYAYPSDMVPAGELRLEAQVKESLLDELRRQTVEAGIVARPARAEQVRRKGRFLEVSIAGAEGVLARRVIVAIGRSGNFRKLGVPGEDLGKVFNRLHDPKDFCGEDVLVVGGGDSALETAIALAQCGANVTLSYRKAEFARPKPDNLARLAALRADPDATVDLETPVSERVTTSVGGFLAAHRARGSIELLLGSEVEAIEPDSVRVRAGDKTVRTLPNGAVFAMIGREPPLDFFRRSGVKIRGETRGLEWVPIGLFFLLVFALYDWKNDGFIAHHVRALAAPDVFPQNVPAALGSLGQWWRDRVDDRSTLVGTLAVSMKQRSFYYTLLYSLCVVGFGIARIRRRRTPYVTAQTLTLMAVQVLPLFLLPELLLPWLGYNGAFDAGIGRTIGDEFFEPYIDDASLAARAWPEWGHPRAYWRAYGFVLPWPLMVYNVFTHAPIAGWLVLCALQTFVLIPLLIRFWGKGAYCGWICSCGGLAETAGDTLRDRMPHGARWNRLNMLGQWLLVCAFVLLLWRIAGWIWRGTIVDWSFPFVFEGKTPSGATVNPVSWKWTVDVFLAGILGVGLYVKYSGRVWCRFACPLAALMHVYARFSRFRILSDKRKCISCNVCTSVCHQGIDVMNFANKGVPMSDPECVRCSACVQACPTGVLEFGQVDPATGAVLRTDRLAASPVRMREADSERVP
jgi:thioredoxin reductase/Fe-S-cluster-containing hydrogenase component 2